MRLIDVGGYFFTYKNTFKEYSFILVVCSNITPVHNA